MLTLSLGVSAASAAEPAHSLGTPTTIGTMENTSSRYPIYKIAYDSTIYELVPSADGQSAVRLS